MHFWSRRLGSFREAIGGLDGAGGIHLCQILLTVCVEIIIPGSMSAVDIPALALPYVNFVFPWTLQGCICLFPDGVGFSRRSLRLNLRRFIFRQYSVIVYGGEKIYWLDIFHAWCWYAPQLTHKCGTKPSEPSSPFRLTSLICDRSVTIS